MTPLERNRLFAILNANGFHAELPAMGNWLGAEATYAPGRCYVSARTGPDDFLAGTSLAAVARALAEEGCETARDGTAPPQVLHRVFRAADETALRRLVRRIFQLSRALPTAPLDNFVAKTRGLPASTEAERLVLQRIGQDIFRHALLEYWSGRCAVTGIDQPELLRASHCKPWSVATDSERLDVYNGLLLVADVDAAFDCGLIAFSESGAMLFSARLSVPARARFENLAIQEPRLLTTLHREYLAWHRAYIFEAGQNDN